MKNLANWGSRLRPLIVFIQRHALVFFFLLSVLITTLFYFDVVFLGKTMLSPGGLTAGVMGDDGPYGDVNPLPPDFSQFAAFMKDLGSNAWAGEPQVAKAAHALRNWDLPLWNDNQAVGKPLAANFLSSAFYPLKLVIYALPTVNGWEIYLLLRFAIGLFFMFLFLRELKFRSVSAFLAATAFAFSGYFVLLQNIQNMDVDLLIPMMFWVVAFSLNLAHRPQVRWVQYILAVGALVALLLSNVPESLLLVLLAGFVYWVYRIVVLFKQDRQLFWRSLNICLKIALPAALIVLPLYAINGEFVLNAITTHETGHAVGSAIYTQPTYVAFYALPYIQNAFMLLPQQPVNGNALNYIGLFGYFLVVFGAIVALRKKGTALFLLVLLVITIAKIHGVPIINEVIGNAPGLNRIMFMKYAQPIVSLCAAGLIGYALEAFWNRTIKTRELLFGLAFGSGLLMLAIRALPGFDFTLANGFLLVLVLVLVLIVGLILTLPLQLKGRHLWVATLGLFVVVELWVFVPRHGRPERYETFTTPPFVTFLQSREGPYRIYAYDGLLYPDISSAFNIDDIRELDGLIVGNYLTYIRYFVSHSVGDRFTGKKSGPGESLPAKIVNNPFVDILNVRYFVAKTPPIDFFPENEINNLFFSVNPVTPSVRETVFDIQADTRRVLFEHSTSVICAPIPVSADRSVLRFSVGIDEQAWKYAGADGVQLVITDGDGKLLFERKVDPVNVLEHQMWLEHSVDLSAYAETTPTLCLYSNAVGSTVADWAGWADLRLTPRDSDIVVEQATAAKLVYRGTDAYVYENTHALNRVFAVGQVTSVKTSEEVIKYMRRPDFDPTTQAVVLVEEGVPELPELDGDKCAFEVVENYQEPKSSLASVDVFASGACLLVWSDTDYPGWKATVDGQEAYIYNTDLMLRGVVLTQGQHHIVMKYRPKSFYLSLIATAVGLALTLAWSILFTLRSKSKTANPKS